MKKDEMVKIIQKMGGKYSPHQIFSDFVEMSALAVQNACVVIHDRVWKERENKYSAIAKKYDESELIELSKMFGLLGEALEENIEDVLGDVYMKAGCGNKYLGQFFTPFHLSKLCASLAIDENSISEDKKIPINEPSVGGGGMIIGFASALNEKGINYQKCMKVTAQDLDWNGVYMSYLQFSLLGIDAVVVQGDTLKEPYPAGKWDKARIFRTPRNMGALMI